MTKRLLLVTIGSAVVVLTGIGIAFHPRPRLVWNASASAPEGLYWVSPDAAITAGDVVVAQVPARFRAFAANRHYIPANVPLVKQVAAGAGDQICSLGREIYRNGIWLAARRSVDGGGRSMPAWQGCVRLRSGQYFLLIAASPLSFDGRYFGPSDQADIIGKAHLLWAR